MRISQHKAGVMLSYLSQGIHILSGLVYTPIMLRLLGQSEFGLYQLVHSVVAYLGLLSFGFASSYLRFYSRAKADGDADEVAGLNGMYMTIFLVIAAVSLVCGGIMTANIRAVFGDGLLPEEYPTARVLMALMVFNLALTFPNSVFDAFTSAHERFFFQKLLSVLQNVLNPFLTLPLLLMGYGSVAMVLVTTALTVTKLGVNAWFSLTKLGVCFRFRGFRWDLLAEMWGFTFFIFLNLIIDQINWNVDKFLLGRMAGTTAVAVYGLGGQINSMYGQAGRSVASVFLPRVNRMVSERRGDRELTELFTRVGRIQFLVLGLVLSGFVFFGRPFMGFWGGKGYEESYWVALWLIVPITVPLMQDLGIEIQRAKNMHRTRSVVYFVIAVCNVAISIPLIRFFGPTGAAVGTAIALTVGAILFMNWYYHNRIGLDMVFFWKSIASILPGLILPCILGAAMQRIPMDSIPVLGLCILGYTAVYAGSMYRFGMNPSERRLLSGPVRKLLRK